MARQADFAQSVKNSLAAKVGYRCSNPFCRIPTIGSNADASGTINIGEAAHITAAEPGGARYDSSLTVDQRKDESNGIWLCRNHAAMIDRDAKHYTVEKLHKWKEYAEKTANESIQGITTSDGMAYTLRMLLDDLGKCNKSIDFLESCEVSSVINPKDIPVTNDYEIKIESLADFIGMDYASRIRSSFIEISSFREVLVEEYPRFHGKPMIICDSRAVFYSQRLSAFLETVKYYDIPEIIDTLEKLLDNTPI